MDRFARRDVTDVLNRYGITSARRASDTDDSEEIILVSESTFPHIDLASLTRDLMNVLPHTKVWVAPDGPRWTSEPI